MSHVALHFALSAALLVGVLFTFAGAVGLVENPRFASFGNPELRPFAIGLGLFGLLTFMAAIIAIIAVIGEA